MLVAVEGALVKLQLPNSSFVSVLMLGPLCTGVSGLMFAFGVGSSGLISCLTFCRGGSSSSLSESCSGWAKRFNAALVVSAVLGTLRGVERGDDRLFGMTPSHSRASDEKDVSKLATVLVVREILP